MKTNTALKSFSIQCNFPQDFPQNSIGKFRSKLSIKIRQKTDYVRSNGTCALYIQICLNGIIKKVSLDISVKKSEFDSKKQRVRPRHQFSRDYNLLIEKKLSEINQIEINYRLSDSILTLEKLLEELENPTARTDFIKFWESELELQKTILKIGTYKQQKSSLRKLKLFKPTIYFYEIRKSDK